MVLYRQQCLYGVNTGKYAPLQSRLTLQIKEQRAKIMEQVCDETRREFLKDQVGLCESVLVERLRHGYLEGYTKNYTPVHINSEDTSLCGKIIDVKITKSFDDYCDAELV